MKVFCDLDGTLLDVAPRHHRVYVEVTRELGGIPLERETYWRLKRDKARWSALLPLSRLEPALEPRFLARFIEKIEDPTYLAQDCLFDGARQVLERLGTDGHEGYLVSLRRRADRLVAQLDGLGIKPFFARVLSGHSESDGHDVKVALIADEARGHRGVIIGDTEADIVTGKKLGLTTVAVTSGIRSELFLRALAPDYVLDGIAGLTEILRRLGP